MAHRTAEQLEANPLSPRLLVGLTRLFEFFLAWILGFALFHAGIGHRPQSVTGDILMALLCAGAAVFAIQLFQGYSPPILRSRRQQFMRVAAGLSLAAGTTLLLGGLLESYRLPAAQGLTTWALSNLIGLSAFRLVLSRRIRLWARNGFMERRVVLVGGGTAAETFIRALERQPDNDVRICGIFDDRGDDRSPAIVAGYPKLGSVAQLTEFARLARIDMLIVTLPISAQTRILSILRELWILPLDIRVAASSSDLTFRTRSHSYVGAVPVLDVFDRPLADWDLIAKRSFDLVLGTLALVLFSPLMLATAIAIKLDTPGPVFFRQKRHGFNNEIIDVWKFRSLRHEMADPLARRLVTRNDARVTRVGRFIRRTSIDELPQLFNVILGTLSLVGPRPHAVHARASFDETFTEIVDGYFGRHKVKPGITGWAQINGWRGEIDEGHKLQKRFEHDLFYIENWSILLDLRILFLTPFSLFKSAGAY